MQQNQCRRFAEQYKNFFAALQQTTIRSAFFDSANRLNCELAIPPKRRCIPDPCERLLMARECEFAAVSAFGNVRSGYGTLGRFSVDCFAAPVARPDGNYLRLRSASPPVR